MSDDSDFDDEEEDYFVPAGIPTPLSSHFTLKQLNDQRSNLYSLTFKNWECRVHGLSSVALHLVPRAVHLILRAIFDIVLTGVKPEDKVRIQLCSSHLSRPIWTPPIRKDQTTVRRIMRYVERVLNSNESFRLDDTFQLLTQHVHIPAGSGRPDNISTLLKNKLHEKRSVVPVRNSDEICLARALVIGKAKADGDTTLYQKLYNVRKPTSLTDNTAQTRLAKDLIALSGLPIRAYSLDDLPRFQEVLPDYMLIVIGVEQLNTVIFSGPHKEKQIMLLLYDGHFDVLTSLSAWFRTKRWCFHCNTGYGERHDHRCANTCKQCLRQTCPSNNDNLIACSDCNRTFFGQQCYDTHKAGTKGYSICDSFSVCIECHRFISKKNRETPHRCGESFCPICKEFSVPADNHVCYMKPVVLTPKILQENANAKFLYFDVETYVNSSGIFIPNLAVVQYSNGEQHTFPKNLSDMGRDITGDLCEFLFQKKHQNYFVIAHNFRGFDGIFILNWLLKNGIVPKVIMNGSKLMQLDVQQFNIRFRDSLNYNPQSLSNWAKTFDVPQQKTQFPHSINAVGYWGQVIPYPDRHKYGYAAMKKKDRKLFLKSYRKDRRRCKNRFDVTKTLVEYCCQDVSTLRCCAEELRKLFMDISGGLCPFTSALTISGLCNYFWRARQLKPEEITIIHQNTRRTNSVKAQKWLAFMTREHNVQIKPEHRIGVFFVDGYAKETNTVYEFYGDLHHGCPLHTKSDTVHPYSAQTMADLHRRTMEREKVLRAQGYRLHVIWECAYERRLKEDSDFRSVVDRTRVRERLDPRKTLYGGRVNALALHYLCKPGEKIFFKDVCSEYPFVNKTKTYPVGPHKVITSNFGDVSEYFGLIQCKILPPQNLHIPILPYRTKKLTFPLCARCADTLQQSVCEHTEEERCLTGQWCTPEIMTALSHGYVIKEIFEVWHFVERRERLFAEYIDLFLALKVQASSWPPSVRTTQEKEDFLTDFFEKEGVKLDPTKMVKNPGLRSLAKLCLNSFWGRLGMRSNRLVTVYIKTAEEFFRYMMSANYKVHSFDLFSSDIICLQYSVPQEVAVADAKTNVILASFTTTEARLHLLKFLLDRGDRTLYFDTDSVMYLMKPGDIDLPTGSMLGELTDELEEGEWIVEMVSTGPKSYSYRTNKGRYVCKVKGFSLSRSASQVINFDSMRAMLLAPGDDNTLSVYYDFNIHRNKRTLEVAPVEMYKKFRVTYDKRVIIPETLSTVPYGFVQ